MLTRRDFMWLATAQSTMCLRAQTGAHVDVAALEREHILASAKAALATGPYVPHAPSAREGSALFSEITPNDGERTDDYRDIAEQVRLTSASIAALVAAYLLTRDEAYAEHAGKFLRVWLLESDTRMSPHMDFAGVLPGTRQQTRDCVLDLVPIAEAARAWSFLADTAALSKTEQSGIAAWFSELLDWMLSATEARLARDSKDRHGSAWLLVTTAVARATRNEKQLDLCRLLFKKPTIRNQITADGHFPQELATPNPYRNTLFNFDMLAGACQLLSSPFDDLWNYELQDGPGMRSAAAFLAPLIRERQHWPFVSDTAHFRDLPGRRAGLLFAARAYSRPEYLQAYTSAPAMPPPADLAYSFPITQPLLWTARAPHGL